MAHHVRMSKKHSRPAHTSLSRTTPLAPTLIDFTKGAKQNYKVLKNIYNNYRVLNKGDKFFTLNLFTRKNVVSIDRLRAAHLVTPDSEPETQQPVEGRSHPFPIPPSQPEASFHCYDEQPKSILRTRHGHVIHKLKRYEHFLLPTHWERGPHLPRVPPGKE